jgi:hypothetical protein
MKKLKLVLDELRVDSFSVTATPAQRGTVNALRFEPRYRDPVASVDGCDPGGGGINTYGTCIGPTYCCQPTWNASCYPTQCGDSACVGSCQASCAAGVSCTDGCTNCSI